MTRFIPLLTSFLLLTSCTQATPTNVNPTKQLLRRNGASQDQCGNGLWDRQVLQRFNAIFFGDFNSAEFRGIDGPLAVQGNFNAPNYNINVLLPDNCSDTKSLDSYGWVLGGNTNSFNVNVYGSVYIAGNDSSLEEIFEDSNDPNCIITDQYGTGLFDFDVVRTNREDASEDLANLAPTHIFDANGQTTPVASGENPNYEVFTLMTCDTRSCGNFPFLTSSPTGILFGQGTWTGLKGANLNSNKTVVINVPVSHQATLNITTDSPSIGFTPCKLIFNFYPVDEYGHFKKDGLFTLVRDTTGYLAGYTLAPRAKIVDGQLGAFAGNLVGREYGLVRNNTNENLIPEPNILWYQDSKCTQFNGCVPIHDTADPLFVLPEGVAVRPSPRVRSQTTYASTRTVDIDFTKTFTFDETILRVRSYTSSETVTNCAPTTVIRQGSTQTVVVPGSTKTVDLLNGDVTVVVVDDRTIRVAPELRVVTETDTLFQTSTIITGGQVVTQTVTSSLQGQCTREPPPPLHRPPPRQGHGRWGHNEWDDSWFDDHTGHNHGPDEECNEYNDYIEWKQYEIDYSEHPREYIEDWDI